MNNIKIIKYILIIILSISLYFTWFYKKCLEEESCKLQKKIVKLQKKLNNLKSQTMQECKLKQKIQHLEQKIKQVETNASKQSVPKKVIKIILPETKIDYSKIVPKVDYKDINLSIEKKKSKEDMEVIPNITFDKDKKIDTIKVNFKTTF